MGRECARGLRNELAGQSDRAFQNFFRGKMWPPHCPLGNSGIHAQTASCFAARPCLRGTSRARGVFTTACVPACQLHPHRPLSLFENRSCRNHRRRPSKETYPELASCSAELASRVVLSQKVPQSCGSRTSSQPLPPRCT